jgi:hypothetical protein
VVSNSNSNNEEKVVIRCEEYTYLARKAPSKKNSFKLNKKPVNNTHNVQSKTESFDKQTNFTFDNYSNGTTVDAISNQFEIERNREQVGLSTSGNGILTNITDLHDFTKYFENGNSCKNIF